ncbi:hypothetical protein ES703_11654 [subsurface metagenome]|nr:T9SS type A sorting domain-containing protein [bacterium]
MTKKVIGIAAALVLLAAVVPLFGQWQGETRITNNTGTSYTSRYGGWSIAADNADVHITWYDLTTTQRMRYFTFPIGSPTETPNGEAVSTTYGYYPAIAVHDGTVDVSWYYSATYDLYTREKNGSWGPIINHGISNVTCNYPAIAFDSDGDLHNVFNRYSSTSGDARGRSVYYQRKNSGAGSYSSPVMAFDPHSDGGSASSYYYAYYPSVCITSDGAIHISVAHNNGYRLKHVWSTNDGASWNHETIGGTNFSYYSYGTSICCDSDDNIYIAYVGYALPRQVFVATNATGNWVATQVSQSTYNYTYYPSICCDVNDNVWVSWDDRSGTTYEVHYNKYDAGSGSWEGDSALTDDDGQYSRYSNFAADENGSVHICWYDRRDGNYEVYYNWFKGATGKPAFVDTLFCEYFEGSWLPTGWTQIINNTGTQYGYPCTWYHGNYMAGQFHHGSWGAYIWWSSYPQNEWLMTFPIDLTGYDPEDSVDLTLGSAFYQGWPAAWPGANYIKVSDDGGATYDEIVNLTDDYGGSGWTYINDYPNPLSFRISQYIGETIKIAFHYNAPNGGYGVWSVDDVCVIVSGGGGEEPDGDSLDLVMTHIIRPKTEEVANVPFTPEILVVNNLDSTAHARISCKIKEIAGPTVYEDVLAVVPLESGKNDIYGFKDFTPEGGKEYNALFVLEHPDDINPDNDYLDKNFHATVGMDVTPFEILAPAEVQDGSFSPKANYAERAGAETTEANLMCEIMDASQTSVYKQPVPHTFTAGETWIATFAPDPVLESGTYTITFWAENPLDGSNISSPDTTMTFIYTTGIAEAPLPERTSLEVLGTRVNFSVATATNVTLRIYDVAGNVVTELVSESRGPGSYTINWNTSGVASGIYFVRMLTPEFNATRKVLILH